MSEGSRAAGILMIVVGGLLTLFGAGCALAFTWLAIMFGLEQGLGAVLELLTSEVARSSQLDEMGLALKEMGLGAEAPSVRAAKAILKIIE